MGAFFVVVSRGTSAEIGLLRFFGTCPHGSFWASSAALVCAFDFGPGVQNSLAVAFVGRPAAGEILS